MLNELNNDWVLWGSLLALLFSFLSLIAYGWKAYQSMKDAEEETEDSKSV